VDGASPLALEESFEDDHVDDEVVRRTFRVRAEHAADGPVVGRGLVELDDGHHATRLRHRGDLGVEHDLGEAGASRRFWAGARAPCG
jgi:hypothetical protein